jgi:iron-sulfur cluster assembly protein
MSHRELPFVLTDQARDEAFHIFTKKNIPSGYGLRIGVKGGGCAGVQFVIGFDHPKPTDDLFDLGAFQVLVEKKHFMHLIGIKVDFVDSETERGFLFTNPKDGEQVNPS